MKKALLFGSSGLVGGHLLNQLIKDNNYSKIKLFVRSISEITDSKVEIIKTDLENELLYLKGSIPGSKNTEVVVRQSLKNINKMTISEKIIAAEEAKKTPDKKKK